MRRVRTVRCFSIAVLAATYACGDTPTERIVEQDPVVRIVAGEGSDSISALPVQGLVIELRGSDGKPAAGVEVRFEAPAASGMSVARVSDADFGTVATVTTDDKGRATVRVRYGEQVGTAWVAFAVPLYGLADTAQFMVRAGTGVRFSQALRDTVVRVGSSFTFRGILTDRSGNPTGSGVDYVADRPIISILPNGIATAHEQGIALIRVREVNTGPFIDSVQVAIVPPATVAWTLLPDNILVKSTALDVIVLTSPNTPRALGAFWEPGGTRIVANERGLIILNGLTTRLATPGLEHSGWPEWANDGYIYFSGNFATNAVRVARIRPDGTGLETISINRGSMPSVSPDAKRVVYVEPTATGSGPLTIREIGTPIWYKVSGTDGALAPRWSPDGNLIAFTRGDRLYVVQPNGTLLRQFEGQVAAGLTWSPDSRWILAISDSPVLYEVSSGRFAKLPVTQPLLYPAWKR